MSPLPNCAPPRTFPLVRPCSGIADVPPPRRVHVLRACNEPDSVWSLVGRSLAQLQVSISESRGLLESLEEFGGVLTLVSFEDAPILARANDRAAATGLRREEQLEAVAFAVYEHG